MYDDNTSNCNGGALYFQSGCSVKIIASSFINNNVVKNSFSPNFCEGGAIALVGEAMLNITAGSDHYECDSHWNAFDDNEAQHGGAIALLFGAKMDISCSTFNNNTSIDGGAIYITGTGEGNHGFKIDDCKFSGNKARGIGGTIYVMWTGPEHYLINISDSVFNHNRAGTGGAIYTGGANGFDCRLYISNTVFYSNMAIARGGAIYASIGQSDGALFSDIKIYACNFRSNKAESNGGAIYIEDLICDNCNPGGAVEVSISVTISEVSFKDNEAKSSGGAIYDNYWA